MPQDLPETSLDLSDRGEHVRGVLPLEHIAQGRVELPGGQIGAGHPVRQDAHLLIGRDGLHRRERLPPAALVLGRGPGAQPDQALELLRAQRQVAVHRQRQPPQRGVRNLGHLLRRRDRHREPVAGLLEDRPVRAGHGDPQTVDGEFGDGGSQPALRCLSGPEHHPVQAPPRLLTSSHVTSLHRDLVASGGTHSVDAREKAPGRLRVT